MFISFEGIDGSGKSVQLERTAGYLETLGYDIVKLREPGGTELAEKIREILLSNESDISPETELFLFEAARSDLVKKVVKPALKEGKVVLCDRFYDSTTAYQAFGRGMPDAVINIINAFAVGGLKPDVTIYLDVDLKTAKKRSKRRKKDRIENCDDEFFLRVIEGYRAIAKKAKDRFYVIDATRSLEETFEEIISIIAAKLKKVRGEENSA